MEKIKSHKGPPSPQGENFTRVPKVVIDDLIAQINHKKLELQVQSNLSLMLSSAL